MKLKAQEMVDYQPTIKDSFLVNIFLDKRTIGSLEQALNLAKLIEYKRGEKRALQQLMQMNQRIGNVPMSLRYALENIEFLKEDGDQAALFRVYCIIGNIYFNEHLYEEALNYFRNAINMDYSNERFKVTVWEKMGWSHHQNHVPDSALFFYQKVLDFHQKKKAYKAQLKTLQSMSVIFNETADCQGALEQNLQIQLLVEREKDYKLLATTYNNIGFNYHCLNDYQNAILNFNMAITLCLTDCELDQIALYSNLGIAHINSGQFNLGSKHLNYAIELAEKEKNKPQVARLHHLKANIYYQRKDYYQAQIFNETAMRMAQKHGLTETLERAYRLAALIYQELFEFESALDFYQKHLALKDSLTLQEQIKQQELLQQKILLERSEKEIKLLLINQKVQELNYRESEKQRQILGLEKEKLTLETNRKENELTLLRRDQEIQEERLKIQELEAARSKQQLLLAQQQLAAAAKDRSILELQREQEQQQLALAQKESEEKARLAEIRDLKNKQAIDQLEIERQQTFQQIAIGSGVGLLIILGLILFSFLNTQRKNRLLAQQNEEIEAQKEEIEKNRDLMQKEREKSDALLLNILPLETAKELKETGTATPKFYKNVSVLFTDFIGFTGVSEQLSPTEIIEELNTCFLEFDFIIEKYGLEKIKTIGDAYMCAEGISREEQRNPKNAVLAALEMQAFIEQRSQQQKDNQQPELHMRLGIHTGNVIAGVVGSKKFAYDIWGDTVNTASRLEQAGKAGKVNISASTYELVKDDFHCVYRGEIEVKNKGDMAMYFVEKL